MGRQGTEQTGTSTGSAGTAHLDPLPAGPYSAMTDGDLVVWARQDDAAFAELFSRHAANVRRRALQRTGSPEAADLVVAATAARARRTIGQNNAGRDVRRWLLDATENECIGWFERGRSPIAPAAAGPASAVATSIGSAGTPVARPFTARVRRVWGRAMAGARAAAQPDRLI